MPLKTNASFAGKQKTSEAKNAFVDKSIPKAHAPFNVQTINGNLFVTYAKQDSQKHDDVAGTGHGYVDVFSTAGRLLKRYQHGSFDNSPWGIAVAPASYGKYANDVLVGNFGNGTVSVFNQKNGHFIATLKGADHKKLVINGLWALTPGSGGPTESANSMFFTAGTNDEADGLFGTLDVVGMQKSSSGGSTGGISY